MKGDNVSLQFNTFLDAATKNEVIRLTPLTNTCHRNYFYQKCFTSDGKSLLFAGDFESNLNYYLLNIFTQEAMQLTEKEGDNTFGGFLSHDDKYLYYVKNNSSLQRVDLKTLQEDTIYKSPADWVAYGTWVANSDTAKIVGIEIHKDSWIPLDSWEAFAKMYHSQPLCRLFRVDLTTGQREIIHEDKTWLGHPIYKPFDDNTVAFCHEGPHDLVRSRIWFINENGTNMRQGKVQAADEHCTHEFWIPDGSKMIYVSFKDNTQERGIYSVDSNTLENKLIMSMPNCSHLMSNFHGTLFVGDGTAPPQDVINKNNHNFANDANLYVFNANSQETRVAGLHKSSWKVLNGNRQITHPHPSFTPNEQGILWSSDMEGNVAIYLTKI
ncbi:MAG: oligogalacturonate lyase family protein [Alphaproteobacteria bacterium]|jgi:oligogalacturonide lyase|nr:oligogalacturonate lyase family protein [Alphaproteobacteria bacterium]